MRWASSLGVETSFPRAIDAACEGLEHELEGAPQLVLMFITTDFRSYWRAAPKILERRWPGAVVVGASGAGVIGALDEVEGGSAIALAGASACGMDMTSFRIEVASPDERAIPTISSELPEEPQGVLLLTNPYYADGESLIESVQAAVPRVPIFGGLASGGERAEELGLFEGGERSDVAGVGVVFGGGARIRTIVSTGCRPIGDPYIVTEREGNLILAFDRGRPLDALNELYESLTPRDRALFTVSLSVGVEVGGSVGAKASEDYLIRHLTGVADDRGGVYVGATLEDYQAVQFHVRDAVTAANDLRRRLLRAAPAERNLAFSGGLLFSCLGRGKALYGRSGHDSDLIREALGDVPIGGLFCNGEIGPVDGRSFLHGYTSVLVLFE